MTVPQVAVEEEVSVSVLITGCGTWALTGAANTSVCDPTLRVCDPMLRKGLLYVESMLVQLWWLHDVAFHLTSCLAV